MGGWGWNLGELGGPERGRRTSLVSQLGHPGQGLAKKPDLDSVGDNRTQGRAYRETGVGKLRAAPGREGGTGKPTFPFLCLPLISVRPGAGLLHMGPCANLK